MRMMIIGGAGALSYRLQWCDLQSIGCDVDGVNNESKCSMVFPIHWTFGSKYNYFYCCPLKLRPSRARVCMHMQASKNKKLGWLLFEESALFGNFAATKQTSVPKHGQRYTFSRTADTNSATQLLQPAKNSSNQPRIGWREVCKDV